MPEEQPPVTTPDKEYSDEEIKKILNTARATRTERDEAAKKAAELEEINKKLQAQMDQVSSIDPKRVKELEARAAQFEEIKLEEQKQFSELKERWSSEKTNYEGQIQKLIAQNRESQIINALEKAFYSCGGKAGKDDDGYSYFDMVRDRAQKHIVMDDAGKITVIDPRDGTRLKTDKGTFYSVEDLMFRLRKQGPTTATFEPQGNGAGGGMSANSNPLNSLGATRESLREIKDPAARLARARELGIK